MSFVERMTKFHYVLPGPSTHCGSGAGDWSISSWPTSSGWLNIQSAARSKLLSCMHSSSAQNISKPQMLHNHYQPALNTTGQLSLAIPPWVGVMSTSQRLVMLCSWGVKAGMVRVWSPCYHGPYLSTLEVCSWQSATQINVTLLFTLPISTQNGNNHIITTDINNTSIIKILLRWH